jgi:hypothetical protein
MQHPEISEIRIYSGEIYLYNVKIEETIIDGKTAQLLTWLDLKDDYDGSNPINITGHDLDGNLNQFERILIREKSSNGYNSACFKRNGKWVWDPCPADEGSVNPFTDIEVISAKGMLYYAIGDICNEAHLVKVYN